MSGGFWGIMSSIPHQTFSSKKTTSDEESAHCKPETEPRVHRVVGPFPRYSVANESRKEPWRAEEHCLFVFEREFQRYMWKKEEEARGGKTLGEPPDRASRPGGVCGGGGSRERRRD